MRPDAPKEIACTKCGSIKPLSSEYFSANSAHRYGFSRQCRECRNAAVRAHSITYEPVRYQRDKAKRDAKVAKWVSENKDHRDQYMKDYRDDPANLDRKYSSHLGLVYGISRELYDAMYKEQGGVCAICECVPNGKRQTKLSVDHCHDTGVIRGLLCEKCNRGLGFFQDEPKHLDAAAVYLRKKRENAKVIPLRKKEI